MLRGFINGLVDIIYPKTCLACGQRLKNKKTVDNIICAECWGRIKKNIPPFCHHCGRHLEKTYFTKNICPACLKRKLHFDRAFSPCVYEGVIKDLTHKFKYKDKDYLGPALSRLMIDFIKEYNLPIEYADLIIPMPLHKTRLREREFNQAEILSRNISVAFKKSLTTDILKRHRQTKTQTELDPYERLLNVKDSFSVTDKGSIKGKNIILIDDVLTTGATSSEAAYTLKDAGAGIVFVLTLSS